jgi:hypothetical protein
LGANYIGLQGTALTRLPDGPSKKANHDTACAGFVPINSLDSCDEFAFESTYQGAYFVGRARTYVAHVPAAQNSYAGTQLGLYYLYNRIIQDDPFYVAITN